jgi:hypothetical protein
LGDVGEAVSKCRAVNENTCGFDSFDGLADCGGVNENEGKFARGYAVLGDIAE